jgi:hypothetical protein
MNGETEVVHWIGENFLGGITLAVVSLLAYIGRQTLIRLEALENRIHRLHDDMLRVKITLKLSDTDPSQ